MRARDRHAGNGICGLARIDATGAIVKGSRLRIALASHPGQPLGAQLPKQVTPEFVRSEVAAGRAIIPANVTILNWSR